MPRRKQLHQREPRPKGQGRGGSECGARGAGAGAALLGTPEWTPPPARLPRGRLSERAPLPSRHFPGRQFRERVCRRRGPPWLLPPVAVLPDLPFCGTGRAPRPRPSKAGEPGSAPLGPGPSVPPSPRLHRAPRRVVGRARRGHKRHGDHTWQGQSSERQSDLSAEQTGDRGRHGNSPTPRMKTAPFPRAICVGAAFYFGIISNLQKVYKKSKRDAHTPATQAHHTSTFQSVCWASLCLSVSLPPSHLSVSVSLSRNFLQAI